jgi:hypothetical protein
MSCLYVLVRCYDHIIGCAVELVCMYHVDMIITRTADKIFNVYQSEQLVVLCYDHTLPVNVGQQPATSRHTLLRRQLDDCLGLVFCLYEKLSLPFHNPQQLQ